MSIVFEPPHVIGDLSTPTWHEAAVTRNRDAADAALEALPRRADGRSNARTGGAACRTRARASRTRSNTWSARC